MKRWRVTGLAEAAKRVRQELVELTSREGLGQLRQRVATRREIRGNAALLASHDWDLMQGLCSEVILLEAGKIIAQGLPEAVRDAGPPSRGSDPPHS